MRGNKNRAPFDSPRSFCSQLYESFIVTYGPFFTILGFILTVIVFFVIPEEASVPFRYVIIIAVVGVYLIMWFLHAGWSAFNKTENTLPRVRCAMQAPKDFPQAVGILIMEPSELFSYDSIVAIYSVEDEIERCIGIGKVLNIQEDKKIQVLVMRQIENSGWDAILNNDANKLRNVMVKPNFPSFAMEVIK